MPQYQPGQYQPGQQPQYPQPYQQPSQYRPEPRQGTTEPPQQPAVAKRPPQDVDAAARVDQNMARSVVLLALMLALAGLIALAPGLGVLVTALLIVVARTVDRGSTALMRRRQVRGGRGKADGLVAVAASPVHLITASLISLFCLILPIVVGIVVGSLVAGAAATSQGLGWQPLSAVGFAAAGVSGLFTAWWGPGGSSLRRGSKITLRKAFRPAWLSLLVAALLGVGAVASFTDAAQGGGATWARTPIQTPNLPSSPGLGSVRDYPIIRDLPLIGR
jgi:hypothetical protein